MPFYLKNVETGLYLDIKDASSDPGTEVITWTFTGGKNQQWTYRNNMIFSELNGLALDISEGEDAGTIIVFNPHGRDNQKWYFDDDFTIRSETGRVLDVSDASRDTGARLIGFSKHGRPNQQFRVEPVNEN